MNRIVGYRSTYSWLHCASKFSSIKKFTDARAEVLAREDASNLNEFSNELMKVYVFDQLSKSFTRYADKTVSRIALLHPQPFTEILTFFWRQCRKGYDDALLAAVIKGLGKTMKTLRVDKHANRINIELYRETFSTNEFVNLIDEVKYALKNGVYTDPASLSVIIQGLIDMEYVDKEICDLLYLKIRRKILNQEGNLEIDMNGGPNPNIDKRYYYLAGDLIDKQKLLEDSRFNIIVNTLTKRETQRLNEVEKEKQFKKLVNEVFGTESEEFFSQLQEIRSQVSLSRENIRKFVDAVISIRDKYLKMAKAQSQNRSVLTDPNMNLGLLELEEQLLNQNLITIEQIQNISLIENSESNLKQIQKIVSDSFKEGNTGKISNYIMEVIGLESIKPREIQLNTKNPYNQNEDELALLANCLTNLAELTSLQVRNVKSVGLVEDQWEKYFMDKNPNIADFTGHELNTDRIFKARYQDLIANFMKDFEKFYNCYSESAFKPRIMFSQALIKLGFYNQGFQLLLNYKITRENFNIYSPKDMICFIDVYSNLSDVLVLGDQKKNMLNRLEHLYDSGKLFDATPTEPGFYKQFGFKEKCTLISWLENSDSKETTLYQKLVKSLEDEVAGITNPEMIEGYGYAASILKENNPTIIEPENSPFNFKNYDNPILDIFNKLFKKHLNIPLGLQQTQFIHTGFSDLSSKVPTRTYLIPQALTSLDGNFIDGNLKAHFARMKNIEVKTVSVMQLITINFNKQIVDLRNKEGLDKTFDKIFKRNKDTIADFVTSISKALAQTLNNQSTPSFRTTHSIRKLIHTLQVILKFNNIQKTALIYNVAIINRYKIIYLLSQLPKQLELLEKNIIHEVETNHFKSVSFKQIITDIIKKLKPQVADFQSDIKKHSYVGKRQTIELAEEETKENSMNVTDFELIDLEVYGDKSYSQYDSWTEQLTNSIGELNCSELELEKCSALTRAFLANGINPVKFFSVSPGRKPRQTIAPAHPANWQAIYRDTPDATLQQASKLQKLVRHPVKTTPDLLCIVDLQNLKFNLKSKCITQVCQLLTKFEFIQDLMKQHLTPTQNTKSYVTVAPRDPKDYFNYLRQKSVNYITNSPYVNYLFSKLEKHQKLEEMFKLLETTKAKGRLLIKDHKISYKDYSQARIQVEDKIIEEIESFEDQIVDHKISVGATSTLRIFNTQVNEQEFTRFINRIQFYNPTYDPDVILSDGNYEQALNIKRIRSEQKLIKLRLLYKLGYNIELTPLDKQYLQNWKSGKLSLPTHFTTATFGGISKSDKSTLAQYTSIASHRDFGLTDLVLEFALLFDDKATHNFEAQIEQQSLTKEYAIPSILFDGPQNKASSYFLNEMEKREFDNSARLSEQEIENILKISGMLKTENPFDRQTYNKVYANARGDIDTLNNAGGRNHLIAAWSTAKEMEFDLKYEAEKFVENNKADIKSIWKKLNGLDYDTASRKQVSKLAHELCERLYILKKNPPIYFSQLVMSVLLHPNISDADRKNILGTIELLKIKLDFFSTDILEITKRYHSINAMPHDQLVQRLKQSSKNVAREMLAASNI